jgi:hypothetical protein
MNIIEVKPLPDHTLRVKTTDGRIGIFDVKPYLKDEAFLLLNQLDHFFQIQNGGYFVEWKCGADLSADTIEAKMNLIRAEEKETV